VQDFQFPNVLTSVTKELNNKTGEITAQYLMKATDLQQQKFCGQCGQPVQAESRFCPACGKATMTFDGLSPKMAASLLATPFSRMDTATPSSTSHSHTCCAAAAASSSTSRRRSACLDTAVASSTDPVHAVYSALP
jgi:NADH pyrophosphatase NudC (nudix superfamily)